MHLKSNQIDGWGAANFSVSGPKRQDNDLVVIESAAGAGGAICQRPYRPPELAYKRMMC